MLFNFSKKSGTPEFPTPRALVKSMVMGLAGSRRMWVTFETKPLKCFVEVALADRDELEINVAYGFREDYQPLFLRQGIVLPEGWKVSKFKKRKRWFGAGELMFKTAVEDTDRIAAFVDQVFPTLFGEPKDYCLKGYYRG